MLDVETKYLLNVDIYLGKTSKNDSKKNDVGKNVVLQLSRDYYGTGRVVTCDNFFSSVGLANELWLNSLKFVGTLRSNKREIPLEFRPHKQREVFSSLHGFNKHLCLVSYVPKANRSVVLLSSQHHIGNFIKIIISYSFCHSI